MKDSDIVLISYNPQYSSLYVFLILLYDECRVCLWTFRPKQFEVSSHSWLFVWHLGSYYVKKKTQQQTTSEKKPVGAKRYN